jgi:hypothetical protein
MPERVGNTRIGLDGEWSLDNFSEFTRTYQDLYAFFHALRTPEAVGDEDVERAHHAFRAYPWRGGWSSVDFYAALRSAIPSADRPRIIRIRYASPGLMEFVQAVAPAASVAIAVTQFPRLISAANAAYTEIMKGIHDRKMNKIDLRRAEIELAREELAFADEQFQRLGEAMGISGDELTRLRRYSGNPAMALKILLSLYRRVRDVAELQAEGKLDMTPQVITEPDSGASATSN